MACVYKIDGPTSGLRYNLKDVIDEFIDKIENKRTDVRWEHPAGVESGT